MRAEEGDESVEELAGDAKQSQMPSRFSLNFWFSSMMIDITCANVDVSAEKFFHR